MTIPQDHLIPEREVHFRAKLSLLQFSMKIPTVIDLFFACVDYNTEKMMWKSKVIIFNIEGLDACGTKELRCKLGSNRKTWDLTKLESHYHVRLGGGKRSMKNLIFVTDK